MRGPALFLIVAALNGACAAHAAPSPCEAIAGAIDAVAVDGAAAIAAKADFAREKAALRNPDWAPGYCRALADNLARKLVSKREGARFDGETLARTGVRYEAFRIAAFRDAGVAPKLYFGFLDGQGATARYERALLQVSAKLAPILNDYAQKHGLAVRVSAKEIAVTHLAEGGALLMTGDIARIETVDPVFGVGLDDYRIGFARFPGLIARLDKAFGSHLSALKGVREDRMTFAESVLGTGVMWLYEKDLAEQKLIAEGRPSLAGLAPDQQFVTASLVYNSGLLFSAERVAQIVDFATGAYLADISERSAPKRPRLPVMTPQDADAWLAEGKATPDQPTSWNAVYHVSQRYGAWVAIARFSSAFTDQGEARSR